MNYNNVIKKISKNRIDYFKEINSSKKYVEFFEQENVLHVYGYQEIKEINSKLNLITRNRKDKVWESLQNSKSSNFIKEFFAEWLMYSDGHDHSLKKIIIGELISLGVGLSLTYNKKKLRSIIEKELLDIERNNSINFSAVSENLVVEILSNKLNISNLEYNKILRHSTKIVSFLHRTEYNSSILENVSDEINFLIEWFKDNEMVSRVLESPSIKNRVSGKNESQKICLLINIIVDAFEPFVAILNGYFYETIKNNSFKDIETKRYLSEIIRLYAPFNYLGRTIPKDDIYKSYNLNPKTKICLWISVANYDSRKFIEPFVISNNNTCAHMSFGIGKHRCPGSLIVTKTLKILHSKFEKIAGNYKIIDVAYNKNIGLEIIEVLQGEKL